MNHQCLIMDRFMAAAIGEARKGISEGGIPIGSVLVKGGGSSAAATTAAYRKRARCSTRRSTAYATPAGSAATGTPPSTPP